MSLLRSILCGCVVVFGLGGRTSAAEEPKNRDLDVIRDESKVPPYRLPEALVSAEGRPITRAEEWIQNRRPQLIALFGNLIYGVVPFPEVPVQTQTEVLKTDRRFLGGKATRKDVRLRFHNTKGQAELRILVLTPNGADKPSPVFLLHSFSGTRDDGHDPHPERPGYLRNGLPIGELLQRGFGLVVVPQSDLVRHNEVEFLQGIHPLFYRERQSFPQSYEWGVISAVAWGGSRAMDYLETDPDVDARRVAIMGHSKLGKAALWTAAQDTRFALVISAQSVAPRPVYVHSGVEDRWADPLGEYLSAYHASEVYRLLGKKGLDSPTPPAVGATLLTGEVGYHNRPGGHSIEPSDWTTFLAFASHHLQRR